MTFSNLFFPFVFLPICLLLYLIMPKRLKNLLLVLCSLVFFAWGTPEYLLLMLASLLFNYFTGLQLGAQKAAGKNSLAKFTLITAVIVNLLLLGFFKYYGFLLESITGLFGTPMKAQQLPVPIGLSFFTFSVLSYLFDVNRGKVPAAKNIINFSLFVTFFPKLVSGPIVQYSAMAGQLAEHPITREKFGSGARLFLIGLAKKVLIANTLGLSFYAISALQPSELSAATAWLGAILYSLMLYFDFGGYSEMAIGLAGMFGFEISKNFDYPYISSSISEFWRRWHISLGAWFRDYIYIPLGGSREGEHKTIRNLLIVWLLTGIWHGANWTFLVWGVYYGLLLVMEKFVMRDVVEKMPKILRHLFTVLLVIIGWVFFFSDSIGNAISYLGSMFGFGSGFFDSTALYYLGSSWLILIVAVVAALPFVTRFFSKLYNRKGNLAVILSVVFFGLLLLLCVASMMNDTYSTFLYFQF